jgi:hypothetical protein
MNYMQALPAYLQMKLQPVIFICNCIRPLLFIFLIQATVKFIREADGCMVTVVGMVQLIIQNPVTLMDPA